MPIKAGAPAIGNHRRPTNSRLSREWNPLAVINSAMLGEAVLQKASRAMSDELHRRSKIRRLMIRTLVWATKTAIIGATQNGEGGRLLKGRNSQNAHHKRTTSNRNT